MLPRSSGFFNDKNGVKLFYKDGRKERVKEAMPDTLLREEAMNIDGREIVSQTETRVQKEDGSWVRQNKVNYQIATDGRWLKMDEFVAISFSGQLIPRDSFASCLNPFELHEFRIVYVNIDGFITELGNVLCADCAEHQKKRLFWKRALGFGLIYNPEEY
jgi:hypothetical protein